jgi:acyl carrier protein
MMTSECSELDGSIEQGCAGPALQSQVPATLLKIWQELLHIPNISPEDDFFELGGDSLGAIRMLERIGREFGDELLEPDIIYTASTFKDLVDAITAALAESQVATQS